MIPQRKRFVAGVVAACVVVLALVAVVGLREADRSSADTTVASSSTPTTMLATPTSDPSVDDRPDGAPAPSSTTTAPDSVGIEAPTETTAAAPVDPQRRAEIEDATDALLAEVLPVMAQIDSDGSVDVSDQLSSVASQVLLSEIEAERLEFEVEGWSREGSYIVDSIEVLDYAESGDTASATVRVCLDASEIVVRRSDGVIVETDPSAQRAWNVFGLERVDGEWRIVGRQFTDDPAC